MTAALEGGERSAARPGRTFTPGKTRYPLYRRLGGPKGRSVRAKNLVPSGIFFLKLNPLFIHFVLHYSLLDKLVIVLSVSGSLSGWGYPHYVSLNPSSVLRLCLWGGRGKLGSPLGRCLVWLVVGGPVTSVLFCRLPLEYIEVDSHELLSGGFVVVFPSGTSQKVYVVAEG